MKTAKVKSCWGGFVLASLLLGSALPCMGQKKELRPPAYFMKVMGESKKTYQVTVSKADSLPPMPMADALFRCYAVVKGSDGTEMLVDIMDDSTRDDTSMAFLRNGERAFTEGNMIEARKNYKSYVERLPNASRVMTFLGQSFSKTPYQDSLLYWYRRAVQANPLDYMAQWFYASALLQVDSAEVAVDHMIKAMVLNRTNPRMYAELKKFFEDAGYRYDAWSFQPRMALKQIDANTIALTVDSAEAGFLPYCMCQAAWKYEPDVATSVVDTSDHYAVLDRRERECLATCFVVNLDEELLPKSTHPAIINAARAAKEREFESYLYYEVMLAHSPVVAYYLTEISRAGLESYVRKYHLKKIAKR